MAMEAQHLIDISLAKITQARFSRGGVSLHKNLLVATVLQKAKFMFMEEISHMVHQYYPNHRIRNNNNNNNEDISDSSDDDESNDIDIMDGEIETNSVIKNNYIEDNNQIIIKNKSNENSKSSNKIECNISDIIQTNPNHCNNNNNSEKENNPPQLYMDLDKSQKWRRNSLKRRKEIEITQSLTDDCDDDVIIKRNKSEINSTKTNDDDGNIDNSCSSSNNCSNININIDSNADDDDDDNKESGNPLSPRTVDIERITSLVSIFNFTTSSSSTTKNDILCSSQATNSDREINSNNNISQHNYLAMTV